SVEVAGVWVRAIRYPPEVVDAAVLLDEDEGQLVRYSVEARCHLRRQRCSTVQRQVALLSDFGVGEADGQVLGDLTQGDDLGVSPVPACNSHSYVVSIAANHNVHQ